MRRVLLLSMGFLSACGWSAADGPWNGLPLGPGDTASAVGTICAPDGQRGAPGLTVRWVDALDAVLLLTDTDPWGRYSAEEVPPGRYTVEVGGGVFEGLGVATLEPGSTELPPLCLDRARPEALVLRTELASATDLVDDRLEGLGLEHVHEGPVDAAAAGQLLGSPAGLVDYGILAVVGELDFVALAEQPGALDGLRDFLGGGGGLYLSGEGWPLLELLDPGRVARVGFAEGGYLEADVADLALAEQLQWSRVGLRLHPGASLFAEGSGVQVLLAGDVTDSDGNTVRAPLVLRLDVEGGEVILASFLAPAPRAGDWWMGDPSGSLLPDGSWDGRGAVLDRLILQL